MSGASQKFDRKLFTLKVSELAREMQAKSTDSDRKASAEARKAGTSSLIKTVDGQLALLDEWLEGIDRICREVWRVQGEAFTPDFVREVLLPEAMTLIGVRESTIKSNLSATALRTRDSDQHRVEQHITMAIDKLRGTIATRYEIEALELTKRLSLDVPSSPDLESPMRGAVVTLGERIERARKAGFATT